MADGLALTSPRSSALPVIIDPDAAVAYRGWSEAREAVLRAVEVGPRLILILGAPGSGKSLLLRDLATRLRDSFDVLLLARGDMSIEAGEAAGGLRRVVLIDQARRLNEATLSGLARLGDCTVVLTGLADQNAGDRLSDAAATIVTLPPIADDEVGDFLAARLARAGLPAELFAAAGQAALAGRAAGQARRLNMLASAALGVAREHGVSRVGKLEVDQAARMLDQPAREPFAMPEPRPERAPETPSGVGLDHGAPALPLPPAARIEEPAEHGGRVASLAAMMTAGADRRGSLVLGALCAAFAIAAAGGWVARHRAAEAGRTIAMAVPAGPMQPAPVAALALLPPPPLPTAPPAVEPALAALTPPPLDQPPQAGPIAAELPQLAEATPVPALATPAGARPADDAPASPGSDATALSVAAPARLVLMFARGDAAATARASGLASLLASRGFAVETRPVRAVTGASATVRYFFAEDRDAADAVLAASGLPGRSLQASPGEAEPALRPGLIELVLPAGGVPAAGESRTRLVQTTSEGRVP